MSRSRNGSPLPFVQGRAPARCVPSRLLFVSTRVWSRIGQRDSWEWRAVWERKTPTRHHQNESMLPLVFFSSFLSFSPHLLFSISLPTSHSSTEKRQAESSRIRDKYPDRIPVREFRFFDIGNYQAALSIRSFFFSSPPGANRESCSLLLSLTCSLLWPRAFDSGQGVGLLKREKRDGERAGEEHESPRGFCRRRFFPFRLLLLFRPQQPRFGVFFSHSTFSRSLTHSRTHAHTTTTKTKTKSKTTRSLYQVIVEKADKSDIPDIDKKKCVW